MTDDPVSPQTFDAARLAKRLLRLIRAGALATIDRASGAPVVTLTAVATEPDGSPILLLSRLAEHTSNLDADPRASILLAAGGRGDPLAHPRLTVTGRVESVDDPAVRRRFLARNPKAALYADFPDFGFRRLVVETAHLNGGFARAARLPAVDLVTDVAAAGALIEAEEGALAHMNVDHRDAIALYATRLDRAPAGAWEATGLDPEGIDMAAGDLTARVTFPEPVQDSSSLRRTLVDLAARARTAAD